MTQPISVEEALAEVLQEQESGESAEQVEEAVTPETQDPETPEEEKDETPEAPAAEGESNVDGTPATDEESEVKDSDVPTSYMGLDLSDLPAEKRAEIIGSFKKQDKYAQTTQQEKTEADKRIEALEAKISELSKADETSEEETEEAPEATDEQILTALGFDPTDPLYEVKSEAALPVAKEVIRLGGAVAELVQHIQAQEAAATFVAGMDDLETSLGTPFDRDALIDFCIENEIDDPAAAYERMVGPERTAVATAASEARKVAMEELTKRKRDGALPRTSGAKTEKKEPVSLEEALAESARELNITL